MPLRDIVVLSLIVSVFVTFAVVLGGVSCYCRGGAARSRRHAAGRRADYPTDGGLITDDD